MDRRLSTAQATAREIDTKGTGYDQDQRWSFLQLLKGVYSILKNKEGDCSTVCATTMVMSGWPVNIKGTCYTGNITTLAKAAGAQIIAYKSLSQLRAGDYVVTPGKHIEFVYDEKTFFSARIDERGKARGGKAGDQTGKEVRFSPAYVPSYGWKYIIRFPWASEVSEPKPKKKTVAQVAKEIYTGKGNWGTGATRKSRVEAYGLDYTKVQAAVNKLAAADKKKAAPKPKKKTVAQVAKEIYTGKGNWGTGATRKKRVEAYGLNYTKVQAAVNKLAKKK